MCMLTYRCLCTRARVENNQTLCVTIYCYYYFMHHLCTRVRQIYYTRCILCVYILRPCGDEHVCVPWRRREKATWSLGDYFNEGFTGPSVDPRTFGSAAKTSQRVSRTRGHVNHRHDFDFGVHRTTVLHYYVKNNWTYFITYRCDIYIRWYGRLPNCGTNACTLRGLMGIKVRD